MRRRCESEGKQAALEGLVDFKGRRWGQGLELTGLTQEVGVGWGNKMRFKGEKTLLAESWEQGL